MDTPKEYANQCRAYSDDWGDRGDNFAAMKLGDAICDLDDRIRALELALSIDERELEREEREGRGFYSGVI